MACERRSSGLDVEPELAFRDDQKPKEKNMKKLQLAILAVSLAGVMSATAQVPAFVNPPETYWSPPWQGGAPYQRDLYWAFSMSPVGGPSDNGTPGAQYAGTLDPTLKITDVVDFTGSVQYFSAAESPDGIAGVGIDNTGSGTLTGTLDLYLDNTTWPGQKNIWIETIGQSLGLGSGGAPVVLDPGYTVSGGQVVGPESYGSLVLQDYGFTVVPNPNEEEVSINFAAAGPGYDMLNSLQIATQCVPEPSTVSLLVLGALALLRRRQGKV